MVIALEQLARPLLDEYLVCAASLMYLETHTSLFEQSAFYHRMSSFHFKFMSLEFYYCSTCLESFLDWLVLAIVPMISLYCLPLGQYGYTGHVVSLPQGVIAFAHSLPRLPSVLDVLVIQKEKEQSHHDLRVRRVLKSLSILVILY